MGEGLFQPMHLLLIVAIALLVFGTSKFAAVGKGLGEGIRNFKSAMKDPDAEKEEAELKIVESYMPASASEEQVDAAIAAALSETGATSAKQMGLVMKAAQAKLAGQRVDGKALSEKVRARLA